MWPKESEDGGHGVLDEEDGTDETTAELAGMVF